MLPPPGSQILIAKIILFDLLAENYGKLKFTIAIRCALRGPDPSAAPQRSCAEATVLRISN